MNKWTVPAVALFIALTLTLHIPRATAEMKPLMAGWEHYFTVSWQPTERQGATVLTGYVVNTSSYSVHKVRILVDMLDAAGQTTSQRIAWVPGTMNGATRLFFEVPVAPAPSYRVQVFSYDRLELPSIMR